MTSVIYGRHDYALGLFIFAAVSDLFDGLVARLTGQKTALGTLLDPLADKALLVTSCILFTVYGWLPMWYAIIVISRDLIVVVGWVLLYLVTHNFRVEPVLTGKIAIALQLLTLTFILLNKNHLFVPGMSHALLSLTAAITVISGLQYVFNGLRQTSAD